MAMSLSLVTVISYTYLKPAMIKIKITNPEEIVKSERNWLLSKVAPYFVDVETKVEEAIVVQLKEVFAQRNIRAIIEIVPEDHRP